MAALALCYPIAPIAQAQQPTGSIPTVTSTPRGPYIVVNLDVDFVNVRAGPNEYLYPRIGILVRGQSAPALGRSADGAWIQVYYPGVPGSRGWVYAPNVRLVSGAFLPIVEAPPTPTLAVPTINPTLEVVYQIQETPTRLPTFTPPAPPENPVFSENIQPVTRIPMGLIVMALGFLGMFIGVASFLRGR